MNTLKNIIHREVITIEDSSELKSAAILMKDHDIGFLVCVKQGKITGVLTDRDIVIRGAASSECCQEIKDIMTTEIIKAKEDSSLIEGCELLAKNNIRRLVIANGDELVGVVSIGDLLKEGLSDEAAKDALIEVLKTHNTNNLYKMFDNSNYMDSVKVDDYKL